MQVYTNFYWQAEKSRIFKTSLSALLPRNNFQKVAKSFSKLCFTDKFYSFFFIDFYLHKNKANTLLVNKKRKKKKENRSKILQMARSKKKRKKLPFYSQNQSLRQTTTAALAATIVAAAAVSLPAAYLSSVDTPRKLAINKRSAIYFHGSRPDAASSLSCCCSWSSSEWVGESICNWSIMTKVFTLYV